MNGHRDLGQLACEAFGELCRLKKMELGSDADLSKNGMRFLTEAYEAEGLGHLCVMHMNAMLGLMKMETVVFAPREKDAPLFNLDWVKAMGKETQIAELYDAQLEPYPTEYLDTFQRIKDRDADLPAYVTDKHWYDDILYPCSYARKGKGFSERFSAAAEDYLRQYLSQLCALNECDRQKKTEKVRAFAETLYAQGGPAVDQFKKLFGEETARRIILRHMYGVE